MIVAQPNGLAVKAVKIRRFQNRITMATEIAVTLIIGHDKHDIGSGRLDLMALGNCCKSQSDYDSTPDHGNQGNAYTEPRLPVAHSDFSFVRHYPDWPDLHRPVDTTL